MNAKKPLLLIVLVVALLAVGLLVPSTVSAWPCQVPTASVVGSSDLINTPESYARLYLNVRRTNDALDGSVVLHRTRTADDRLPLGWIVGTEFTDQPYWPDFFEQSFERADFHKAFTPYSWPTDLGPEPLLAGTYYRARIADFVCYIPNPFPELAFLGETYPHRYVVIDFLSPYMKDLIQVYGWAPIDDTYVEWYWKPQLDPPESNPDYAAGDPVPVSNGWFWVYAR
jgi:hypothetical protein